MYDFLFLNGKIFTADDGENQYTATMTQDEYTAMAVQGERIVWLGSDEEAEQLKAHAKEVRNLQGGRILPGLIDSHMHAIMLANCCKQIAALPPEVYSISDLVKKIRSCRENIEPGEWIQGWGFDEGKLAEHRTPNRWDLDRGAEDVPIYFLRSCVHIGVANSKALELAGITRDTKDPEGGRIGRDAQGEPNGILYETARYLVSDKIKKQTVEAMADNLVDLGKILVSQGITTCTDMGEFMELSLRQVFQRAIEKGYQINTVCYHLWDYVKSQSELTITKQDMDSQAQIRILGVKLIGDGSVSGRTAWCDRPYEGTEEYGISTCSDEDLDSAIDFAKKQGCQVAIHAMGARAIEKAIARMEREEPWLRGMPTFRLEHVAMPMKASIEAAKKKNIMFVTQPIFLYSEIESYLSNLGENRTKECYPVREFVREGVNFALSTDAPATAWAQPSDPFSCIKGAVTRIAWDGTDCGREHRLSIKAAILGYTREGAKVLGYPDRGILKVGNKADFILLNQDIFKVAPMDIDKIRVMETYLNGKLVYYAKKDGRDA